jgi:hypothetical protein
MTTYTDGLVLLFYRDFEKDTFFKNDRYLKRIVRPVYTAITRKQKVTGFLVWYRLLVQALKRAGYDVRENDYRFARKHPNHPVGVAGYPSVLDDWNLPNPAVLGPGLFDHPGQRPNLMSDPRFKSYIITCDWMRRLFEPAYGDCCVDWFAGIDTDRWEDTRGEEKDIDFLVYDKIRWDHDQLYAEMVEPMLRTFDQKGLRYEIIRYRFYDYAMYQSLLKRSRAMLFLCEHETQGFAYQECLASNVPILAWDNGYWQDPMWRKYEDKPVPASSVPYFSSECGERFADLASFPEALETFLSRLPGYEPRAYVRRELSFERSAELYMAAYSAVGANLPVGKSPALR